MGLASTKGTRLDKGAKAINSKRWLNKVTFSCERRGRSAFSVSKSLVMSLTFTACWLFKG